MYIITGCSKEIYQAYVLKFQFDYNLEFGQVIKGLKEE